MLRGITAYLTIVGLLFASLVLADARGRNHVAGTQIALCSGATVTTITVGPDGQPQKHSEPCPDGVWIFAASLALPSLPSPEPRLLNVVQARTEATPVAHEEPSPAARSPPVLV